MASTRKHHNKRIKVADGHHWIMPHKNKMFVSVYSVSRHYGGPEEGGWWYDWYQHVATTPRRVKACRLLKVRSRLEKKFAHIQSTRRRSSVIGGADLVIVNERVAGESRSTETPHYE